MPLGNKFRTKLIHFGFSLACLTTAPGLAAKPWIGVGELELRHHVELLSSTGIISVPISQWPLMWGSILPDLKRAQSSNISARERYAVDSLLARFQRERQPSGRSIEAAYSDQNSRFLTGFGNHNNSPTYSAISTEFVSNHFAGAVRISYDHYEQVAKQENDEYRYDGSYLAFATGNWALSLNAIDRWWGPGWQSSLLLSHNAEAVPSISLQRNRAHTFQSPLLSWLGPWQLQAFAGQLEQDREIAHAKLLGFRFAAKPTSWLEIAFTRTAQWGGGNREENYDSFEDLLLGKDHKDDTSSQSNKPGNQLSGLDIKALWPTTWGGQGVYFQYASESEFGELDHSTGILGLNWMIISGNQRLNGFYEVTLTTSGAWTADEHPDYTYEHSVYKSGYRHKGRAIGASIDNDSELETIGIDWMLPQSNRLSIRHSRVAFNLDGGGAGPAGQSQGQGKSVEVSLTKHFGNLQTELGALKIDQGLRLYNQPLETKGGYIRVSYIW